MKRDAIHVLTIAFVGTIAGRKKMMERLQQAIQLACETAPLPNGCDEVVFYKEERSALEEPQALRRVGKGQADIR